MQHLLELISQFWLALKTGHVAPFGYWAYPLITVLVAIEGPIVILLASAAASTHLLKPVLVFVAAACGNLVADTGWYMVGYLGKLDWFKRGGRRIGIDPETFDKLRDRIHDHAVKILFAAKITNAFIVPALIIAGIARVPWRKWFPYIVIGETLVTGLLVAITYFAADNILKVEKGIEYFGIAISAIVVLAFVFFLRGSSLRDRLFDRLLNDNDEQS
jgi:membrane protein DedA with SNARE-associated domain